MQSTASSSNIIFAHIGQQNVESMLSGIAFGILLISIIVAFTLRSLLLGAISLLCNALPFLLALGFWGLGVGEIGLGVSVVAGMALGIVVDDTVHFLSKYQYNLKQGLGSREAVSRVFGQIGLALTATTVSLVAGFLILANSNLSLNVDMGIMTALTIGIALVLDFLFLPALLILFHKRSAHHG
jgi:predicted RND superfamily exporter protein